MASTSQENVAKRGPTALRKLKRKRDTSEKLVVEWNSRGQAIGKNRSTFMSYIGVCARSLVDINIPRWDHVPKEIKESVWTAVSDVFEIPANKHDWVIAIACDRWRSFKTKLKRFMYDKDGNICPNPPLLYSFINQETWNKYISTRQSAEFMEQSEKHREIAKKNIYKYRGSRKGYVGIEEEMVRANEENNNFESPLDASFSTPNVSRSLLWKKARIKKDGNMDESVRQVVAKMDSLSEQVAKGEISLSGRQDILTTALGTKEHPGRVRGVGERVTITKYFGRDVPVKCSSQLDERFNSMEEQLIALNHMVTDLLSTKGQQSTIKDLQPIETWEPISFMATSYSEFPEGWTECQLASPEPGNSIVATGKVFNTHGTEPVMLHNKPLEPGYMKVTIIDPKVQDAPLPMPTDEADTVFEAVGAFVAWPTNLIFRNTMESQSDDRDERLDNQIESLVSKTLVPAMESQSNPLDLVCQIAAEINDDNIAPEELLLLSHDKDEGLIKQHESTVSKTLTPVLESQSNPLKIISRFAAELNDNNISTKGKKVKGERKQIKRQQPKALAPTPSTKSSASLGDQVAVHQQQKLTTLTMKLMYRCARGMTSHDTITIDMPLTAGLDEHNILITKDELLQWLFQENVQASHVSVYIKYLSNLCEEWGNSQMFVILRPQILSPDANHTEDEEVQYIADAMKGANRKQLYLAPYKNGGHWMMCAIHPLRDQAYWLDPAGNEAHPDAKKVVQLAIRKFYFQKRRKKPRSKTQWFHIQCPRQVNNEDSGYFVLRYMQDIIERRQDAIPEQYYEDSTSSFEQHHIDEVRDKWVEFVQNHMD